MELKDVKLYRITHIRNIPHILEHGITHRDSPNANPNFVSIGDQQLIDNRAKRKVEINNGKIDLENPKTICLGDFIPFHFGVRMPMLYIIQQGENFVERAVPPEDIVYLACSLDRILSTNIDFYFSDGHPTNDFTFFYDRLHVDQLTEIID